jgi:hypothetical protein
MTCIGRNVKGSKWKLCTVKLIKHWWIKKKDTSEWKDIPYSWTERKLWKYPYCPKSSHAVMFLPNFQWHFHRKNNKTNKPKSALKQAERNLSHVTQVVGYLPSECRALSSNPNTAKKWKQKQNTLIVIKAIRCWCKKRYIDQCNKTQRAPK